MAAQVPGQIPTPIAGTPECKDCSAWLDECDRVEYGNLCRDCVFKHPPCGDTACACAIQQVTCWSCGGDAVKVEVAEGIRDIHPYPHQFYQCTNTTCSESEDKLVRCKGCFETTINWWSQDSDDIWDDLDQCATCGAIFCPGCNQHDKGCRYMAPKIRGEVHEFDAELYCDSCPSRVPTLSRHIQLVPLPT